MMFRTGSNSAKWISPTKRRPLLYATAWTRSFTSARYRERAVSRIFSTPIFVAPGIFSKARAATSARVIFASTNHTIGFHERSEPLTEDCHFRPDSFYGLSKAYGELLARHYWDKHGVESGLLRIGSCFEVPADQRQLSTWLSFRDLTDLVSRCIDVTESRMLGVLGRVRQ